MDHRERSRIYHHNETHGTSDNIDQNTAVDDVKRPGFFERVKEDIEAIISVLLLQSVFSRSEVS
ncbi:hypothetical protein Bca52824_015007 [Brassica carinata]|uniref:Uncharacterized protein n=1 Tax=Brassica carinata TaxID=52824 RepID=A0A8X7W177_BRACI|nr:hypothetical protein Bca52824_015007 [Brassica carinata]